jgi:hypothetical protein
MARPEGAHLTHVSRDNSRDRVGVDTPGRPRVRLSVAGGTITPRGGCRGWEIGLLHRRALHLQMSTVSSSATPAVFKYFVTAAITCRPVHVPSHESATHVPFVRLCSDIALPLLRNWNAVVQAELCWPHCAERPLQCCTASARLACRIARALSGPMGVENGEIWRRWE